MILNTRRVTNVILRCNFTHFNRAPISSVPFIRTFISRLRQLQYHNLLVIDIVGMMTIRPKESPQINDDKCSNLKYENGFAENH